MKSPLVSLLISVAFLGVLGSCQLADSGRMGVLEFQVDMPDILKSSSTQSSERAVFADSDRLEIYMFQDMQPLINSGFQKGDQFTNDDRLLILEQRHISHEFDLGTNIGTNNGMDYTVADIEPGIWNILIVSFDKTGNWESADYTSSTLLTDVEIKTGINLIDAPLKYNTNEFGKVSAGSAKNLFLNVADFSNGLEINNLSSPTTEVYLYWNEPASLSFRLYDAEGYLLKPDSMFSGDSEETWEFTTGSDSICFIEFILSGAYDGQLVISFDVSIVRDNNEIPLYNRIISNIGLGT